MHHGPQKNKGKVQHPTTKTARTCTQSLMPWPLTGAWTPHGLEKKPVSAINLRGLGFQPRAGRHRGTVFKLTA